MKDPEPTSETPNDPADRFVDEGVLGRGGSAVVRNVFDRQLLRHVACKWLTAEGPRARRRFLTEAQITAQLQHPHIVPVHEHGRSPDGRMFMTMKRVSGQTLRGRIRELGAARLEPEPLAELLTILEQVCDAVAYAHSRGVIHRDLKPTNVMVGEFGQVYVMDWGIARVIPGLGPAPVQTTMPEGTVAGGTPAYMAPEQGWDDEPADPRIDVYALGGILYAILTGRSPHRGGMVQRMLEPVVPPQEVVEEDVVVPPGLASIAMRALAREPDDRYPDVLSLRADLIAFRSGTWQLPTRRIAAGTIVLREGEVGEEAFLVVRGRCVVEREGAGIVNELGPGDVFGELAVLTGRPRDATIRASTDTVLQVVGRAQLTEGLGLDSWTGRFVQALAMRVRDLDTRER